MAEGVAASTASSIIEQLQRDLQECKAEQASQQLASEQLLNQLEQNYARVRREYEELSSQQTTWKDETNKAVSNAEALRRELETAKNELTERTAMVHRASREVESLQSDKRQLATLNERKDAEVERLQTEFRSLTKKYEDALAAKSQIQQELDGTRSQLLPMEFARSKVEQERDAIKKHADWLTKELESRSSELSSIRLQKTTDVAELQGRLDVMAEECNRSNELRSMLQRRNEELNLELEKASEKMREIQKDADEKLESVRRDLQSQTRLATLYKESSEEVRDKVGQLTTQLESVRRQLSECERKREEESQRAAAQEAKWMETLKSSEGEVVKLRTRMADVEQVLLSTSGGNIKSADGAANASSSSSVSVNENSSNNAGAMTLRDLGASFGSSSSAAFSSSTLLSPAATAASLMKQGYTLTEVCIKYAEVCEELRREKAESRRLKGHMDDILKDLNAKAPVILEQKREFERVLFSHSQLSQKMQQTSTETQQLRMEATELRRRSTVLLRENSDLSQQLQVLLNECTLLRRAALSAGISLADVSTSVSSSSSASAPMDSEDDNGSEEALNKAIAALSSGREEAFISEQFVNFTDIMALQAKNRQLLHLLRRLTDLRSTDASSLSERIEAAVAERVSKFAEEVQRLREEREAQQARVTAILKQRDIFEEMLQRAQTQPQQKSSAAAAAASSSAPSSPVSAAPAPAAGEVINEVAEDYARALEEMRMEFKKHRDTLTEELSREKELREKSNSEAARSSLRAEVAEERAARLIRDLETSTTELHMLRESNSKTTNTVLEQQRLLGACKEDSIALEHKLRSLQQQLENSSSEVRVLRDREKRLLDEIESFSKERTRLDAMSESMQRLQSVWETREAEARRKLESELTTSRDEWMKTHKELESERSVGRDLIVRHENEMRSYRERLEQKDKEFAALREEIQVGKETLRSSHERISSLQHQLNASEERLNMVLRSNTSSSSSSAPAAASAVDVDAASQLSMLELQVAKLQEELQIANDSLARQTELNAQIKGVANANEETLRSVSGTFEQYKAQQEATIAALQSESERLKTRASELEDSLKQSDGRILSLQQQLEESQQAVTQAQTKFDADMIRQRTLVEEAESRANSAQEEALIQSRLHGEAESTYQQELLRHAKDVEELTKVRNEFAVKSHDLANAKGRLESLDNMLKSSQESWARQKQTLEVQLAELDTRNTDLKHHNDLLHSQVDALSSQIKKMQSSSSSSSMTSLEQFINPALLSSTSAASASSEGEQQQNTQSEELREVIRYLRREKDIAENKLELATEDNARVKQQCDMLTRSLEEARAQLDRLQQSALEQQQQGGGEAAATAASEGHRAMMQQLEQLNLLRESNVTLRAEAERSAAVARDLEVKCKSLESELSPLKDRMRLTEKERDLQAAEIKSLNEDLQRWKDRVHGLLSKYQTVDAAEHQKLIHECDGLRVEADKLRTELVEVKAELTAAQISLEQMTRERDAKAAEAADFDSKWNQSKKFNARKKEEYIAEKNALQAQLKDLEKSLESAKQQGDLASKEKDLLQRSLDTARAESSSLSVECDRLRKDAAGFKEMVEKLQANETALQGEQAKLAAQITKYKKFLDTAKLRIKSLEEAASVAGEGSSASIPVAPLAPAKGAAPSPITAPESVQPALVPSIPPLPPAMAYVSAPAPVVEAAPAPRQAPLAAANKRDSSVLTKQPQEEVSTAPIPAQVDSSSSAAAAAVVAPPSKRSKPSPEEQPENLITIDDTTPPTAVSAPSLPVPAPVAVPAAGAGASATSSAGPPRKVISLTTRRTGLANAVAAAAASVAPSTPSQPAASTPTQPKAAVPARAALKRPQPTAVAVASPTQPSAPIAAIPEPSGPQKRKSEAVSVPLSQSDEERRKKRSEKFGSEAAGGRQASPALADSAAVPRPASPAAAMVLAPLIAEPAVQQAAPSIASPLFEAASLGAEPQPADIVFEPVSPPVVVAESAPIVEEQQPQQEQAVEQQQHQQPESMMEEEEKVVSAEPAQEEGAPEAQQQQPQQEEEHEEEHPVEEAAEAEVEQQQQQQQQEGEEEMQQEEQEAQEGEQQQEDVFEFEEPDQQQQLSNQQNLESESMDQAEGGDQVIDPDQFLADDSEDMGNSQPAHHE